MGKKSPREGRGRRGSAVVVRRWWVCRPRCVWGLVRPRRPPGSRARGSLPGCQGGRPGSEANPSVCDPVWRWGLRSMSLQPPPSPRCVWPSAAGSAPAPRPFLAGLRVARRPSPLLLRLSRRRGPSSRWVRPPPLLVGRRPPPGLPPSPVGVVSPARSWPSVPARRGRGGSRLPRRCASLAVCCRGARCGPRPPVSSAASAPARPRAVAVSGPDVVSRRDRVRLATAGTRGCRRVPTGGLPGSAPVVSRPPVPRLPVRAAVVHSGGRRGSASSRLPRRPRSPPAAPRPVWPADPKALPMPTGWGGGGGVCGKGRKGGGGEGGVRAPGARARGRVPDPVGGVRPPELPFRARCRARRPVRSPARSVPSLLPRVPSLSPRRPSRLRSRSYLVDPASSICLSQRLSHACLSTHGRYSETANGSLNQLWFLWSLAPLLLG